MYEKYKSPFGYQVGDNGIDSYGVDHSGFSLRDEIEYQTARDQRESQLMQMYNNQGITDNYPQYTTNFWGDAGNNYGFGSSNISSAISTHPAMNTIPTPLQPAQTQIPQAQASPSWSDGYSSSLNNMQSNPTTWDNVKNFAQNAVNTVVTYTPSYYAGYAIGTAQNTFNKLKDLYGAYKQNGATYAAQQYGEPSVRQAMKAADWLSPLNMSDVNKHQYVSCVGSTGGPLATAETLAGGIYKEYVDYNKKMNNQDLLKQYGGKWGVIGDGFKDLGNDIRGAWKGIFSNNPEECEELLPEQYRKTKRSW